VKAILLVNMGGPTHTGEIRGYLKSIFLVNMGGPTHTGEIRGYLKSIFADPAILPLPGLLRNRLAGFISGRRAPKVAERYNLIGGGSPLPKWTAKLRDLIDAEIGNSDNQVLHAFRYSPPTIENAVNGLNNGKIDEIILLPLFPHRTEAMIGSIEKETARVCENRDVKIKSIPAWGNREEVLSIWSDYIDDEIKKIPANIFVLFVAHGIPLRNVNRGDDYPHQVRKTAENLGNRLPDKIGWSLAFQSRVGPVKWTGPYLEDEIIRASKTAKNLLLVPLSFVADCLETLYDLDIVAPRLAKDAGFANVKRVRVFNDDPRFAKALASFVSEVM
jgi:ferrochelatase